MLAKSWSTLGQPQPTKSGMDYPVMLLCSQGGAPSLFQSSWEGKISVNPWTNVNDWRLSQRWHSEITEGPVETRLKLSTISNGTLSACWGQTNLGSLSSGQSRPNNDLETVLWCGVFHGKGWWSTAFPPLMHSDNKLVGHILRISLGYPPSPGCAWKGCPTQILCSAFTPPSNQSMW